MNPPLAGCKSRTIYGFQGFPILPATSWGPIDNHQEITDPIIGKMVWNQTLHSRFRRFFLNQPEKKYTDLI